MERVRAAVLGAGRMGVGIGLVLARAGAAVTFLARDAAAARHRLDAQVVELIALGWLPRSQDLAIDIRTSVGDLAGSDVVVETISEDRAAKRILLAQVSAVAPNALLGTNTSSFSIADLATSVHRPERFAGTHYWYPPPLMPLVELVPGPDTAAETVDRWAELLSDWGKIPVPLRRDVPGFLWNRLQVAVLRESKHLVDSGVADAATVDLVVEQGLARRYSITGPLASAVLGGLATFEAVGRNLLPVLSQAQDLDGLGDTLAGYVHDPGELERYRNARLAAATPESSAASR